MIFEYTRWIRSNADRIDKYLARELISSYQTYRYVPCFLHGIFNKLRFYFKKVDVIVRIADDAGNKAETEVLNIIRSKKAEKRRIKRLGLYPASLSYLKINRLLELDCVKGIYLDREVKALLDKAGPTINAPEAWNYNNTGRGVTVAVLDTGVYPHDDLVKPKKRIIAFKDFVKGRTEAYDDNGHGTHVAGVIAGNGYCSDGRYRAPAYESYIIGVKVLSKFGTGLLSTIISGIDWCIENKTRYAIKIMCLSLGSPALASYKHDLLCEAVEAAWDAGIVVCAAAGNDGPESGTIASPGIDPNIITVGAMDDAETPEHDDDKVALFSGRGPTIDGLEKPDVLSPGVNIISLRSPGSYLDKRTSSARVGDKYLNMSGTSMATPLCCSLAALILEKNPTFTPDDVKKLIADRARDMGYDRYTQGFGCICYRGV